MTIALSLKVHDGVVLAADSASTLIQQGPNGEIAVLNVYNNANKIVNLYKGLPLGIITWGSGSIGSISITTVFKDLRCMLTGDKPGPNGQDWKLDPSDYTVSDVAARVKEYVHDGLYQEAFGSWPTGPELGLIVAGYSSNGNHAEEYQIEIQSASCNGPQLLRSGPECGLTAGGQPEHIARLVMGVDPRLANVLQENLGVPADQVGQALQIIQSRLALPIVQDAMPFQDALDLAEFLVDATVKMSRFMVGPATVGGPIEVAGITQHEGFKWVKRKHYYRTDLNPRESQ